MPIYERPTKSLMADWVREHLPPERTFDKSEPVGWFAQHYPKIKKNTVQMHVEGMAINNSVRKHHPAIRPGDTPTLAGKPVLGSLLVEQAGTVLMP